MRSDAKKLFYFSAAFLTILAVSTAPSANAQITSVNAWFDTIDPNQNEPIVANWDQFGTGYILVVQPNRGDSFRTRDELPLWELMPSSIRTTIITAIDGFRVTSYYEIIDQNPPTGTFQRIFPTSFQAHEINGAASTSTPGEYQVLFIFTIIVNGFPQYSCVTDTFVVTGLAVVPEPSALCTVLAITAAVAVFTGFGIHNNRFKDKHSKLH